MKVAEDLRKAVLQAAIDGKLTGGSQEGWRYVRLGDVVRVISGTSYEKHEVCREGIRIIRGGNLVDEKIVLKDDDVFLPNQYANKGKQVQQNDIVIIASTGSLKGIGRAAFIDSNFDEPIQIGAFLRIIRPVDSSLTDYLKVIFDGSYYRSHISSVVNGIGIKNIREKHITEFPILLPPINAQHRIVSRLDAILPLIAELEAAENELEALKRNFPGDMRDSLLQAAIQGRLTGSSTENWRWVRLREIGDIIGGGTPDTSNPEYWVHGRIAWITPADMGSQKYISHGARYITEKGLASSSARLMPKGSIVFSSRAPIGYIAIAENELCTNQGCKSVRLYDGNMSEYVYFALLAMRDDIKKMGSGTTFKEISVKTFGSVMIPLPPLDEQKRIVSRLNELLPLCKALEETV